MSSLRDANLYGFVGIFLRGENLSSFPLLLALLSLFSLDVHTSFCWASNMSSGAFEGEKLKAVIDMNTTTFQNTERRGSKLLWKITGNTVSNAWERLLGVKQGLALWEARRKQLLTCYFKGLIFSLRRSWIQSELVFTICTCLLTIVQFKAFASCIHNFCMHERICIHDCTFVVSVW